MEQQEWDTIVIGAGVLGCATAYHLKKTDPKRRILVLDRGARAGLGNTRKSVALFRDTFTSSTNRKLVQSTIAFFDDVEKNGYSLGLNRCGYYWLLSKEKLEFFEPQFDEMERSGVQLERHTREEVFARMGDQLKYSPGLYDSCGKPGVSKIHRPSVDGGVLSMNGGSLSPLRLTGFYLKEFLAMGGDVRYSYDVKSLILEGPCGPSFRVWDDVCVTKVIPTDPKQPMFRGTEIVVAAGCWAPSLLDPIGLDCMVKSRTRQAFGLASEGAKELHAKNSFPDQMLPVIILPVGNIYMKPVKSQGFFVAGCADMWGRQLLLDEDAKPDLNFLASQIQPVINAFFPALQGSSVPVKWAGQYCYNSLDGCPFVFKSSNVTVVVGASGSGIMKSDAIGRVAAACHFEKKQVELFDGSFFTVSDLGMSDRNVEREQFII